MNSCYLRFGCWFGVCVYVCEMGKSGKLLDFNLFSCNIIGVIPNNAIRFLTHLEV